MLCGQQVCECEGLRQDVAEMTGTTLNAVGRVLISWESQGLVEGGQQRIMIRDLTNCL